MSIRFVELGSSSPNSQYKNEELPKITPVQNYRHQGGTIPAYLPANILENPTAALATDSRIIIGFDTGRIKIINRSDYILLRELRGVPSISKRTKVPITSLSYIASADILAVICSNKCALHDLNNRKVITEFSTKSAKYVFGGQTSSFKPKFVVGSNYKIRIYNVESTATTVLDAPSSQRIRGIYPLNTSQLLVLVGNGTPKLFILDLDSETMQLKCALPQKLFSRAHNFHLSIPSILGPSPQVVFIGSSNGALLLSLNPLRILWQTEAEKYQNACEILSETTNIALIAVQLDSEIAVLNPSTGSTLVNVRTKANILSSQTRSSHALVTENDKLKEMHLNLPVSSIITFPKADASSLGLYVDNTNNESNAYLIKLREIQFEEATDLFNEGAFDESMHLFCKLEELSSDLNASRKVLTLISDYLEHNLMEEEYAPEEASVFSVRTKSGKHKLDSVVAFLAFLRRKARLLQLKPLEDLKCIDTILFICYFNMRSPLLGPLLRSPNYCDSRVIQEKLLNRGKWRELVWFLRSRGNDREALKLLTDHNDTPENILSYLEKVDDVDLVFEFAEPIIQKNPKLAKPLFFEHLDSNSSKIFDFLIKINQKAAIDFAFSRVRIGDVTPKLHNTIVKALASDDDQTYSDFGSLKSFIQSSNYIEPRILLRSPCMLPPSCQSMLYEKLGEFKTAVDIYISSKDIIAATKCAEKHKITKYLFENLPHEFIPQFLNIVGPDHDLKMEDILPRIAKLKAVDVLYFLVKFMSNIESDYRTSITRESINRAALAEYSVELCDIRSGSLIVDQSSHCAICHKKLGTAVSAISGDGDIVHYACYIRD